MLSPASGFFDRQLESRLKWLMFGRLAIAGICLFTTFFTAPPDFRYAPYYPLLAAILLNLIYLLAARGGAGPKILARVQLALDVLVVGVLVYFTGIDRYFAFLYFAVVIAAAIVAGGRAGIAAASGSSIVLAGISTLYFLTSHQDLSLHLPFVGEEVIQAHTTRLSFLLPFLFFFALSLHVVALLAGRLTAEASRVRILNDEILQNMAGGVLAADRFGGVQFVNAQAARLLGLPEGATGRQIDDVLPRDVASLLRQAIVTRDRVARELRINGSLVDVAVSCLADGERGELRGVVAIVNDLSLRLRMEEMTLRAERFEALLQMSASMAHEIRNPLASIRGAAQELESTSLPKPEDRQLLKVVVRESDRLNQIISDFLDYASDRPMEMSLFDIADLLRETALMLEARQDRRRIEIARELPRSMVCRGSPQKLKQVFLNLGLNALDACAQNGRPGRIVFRCLPSRAAPPDPRDGVLIEIVDNGRGMPPEDLARIFSPFFTTKPHGTGMGLAIARRIVQGHGGEINLESLEGRGTTVRVWLPS